MSNRSCYQKKFVAVFLVPMEVRLFFSNRLNGVKRLNDWNDWNSSPLG
jgi:hypothetical protein